MFHRLIEATLSQIANKQRSITKLFPDFFSNPIKVPGIIAKGGLRMTGKTKDTWNFKVHSGSEEGTWYEVNLKWKNVVPELQRAVANRKNWNKAKNKIDLKKVAAVLYKKLDVELLCECPADLYYGAHYIRSQDKYRAKYGEPEGRSPDIRNPKKYGAYCKHIQALFKALPWYKSTMAGWLKEHYSAVIKKAEQQATKTATGYQTIAKKLGKRKRESIEEAVATKNDSQKLMVQKYGKVSKKLSPSTFGGTEEGQWKFWLLNNGVLIPVEYTHDDTAKDASTHFEDLLGSGAVRGYVSEAGEMGVDSQKFPNSKQRATLRNLYIQYKVFTVQIETADESYVVNPKSAQELDYFLTYGEDVDESIEEASRLQDMGLAGFIYPSGSEVSFNPAESEHESHWQIDKLRSEKAMEYRIFPAGISSDTDVLILRLRSGLTSGQIQTINKILAGTDYTIEKLEVSLLNSSIGGPKDEQFGMSKHWSSMVKKMYERKVK